MQFDWLSNAFSFLIGTAVGAAGKYFADKFTDQRRGQEFRKEAIRQFKAVKESMPKLITEMKEDLGREDSKFVREFFVTSKKFCLNTGGNCFIYYWEDHDELQGKMNVLENFGYIMDITPRNAKKYRMAEEFVELIRKYG